MELSSGISSSPCPHGNSRSDRRPGRIVGHRHKRQLWLLLCSALVTARRDGHTNHGGDEMIVRTGETMLVRTRLYAEVKKEHMTEWLLNLKSFEEAHEDCQLHIEVNDEDITPEEVKTLASLFEQTGVEVEVIPREGA